MTVSRVTNAQCHHCENHDDVGIVLLFRSQSRRNDGVLRGRERRGSQQPANDNRRANEGKLGRSNEITLIPTRIISSARQYRQITNCRTTPDCARPRGSANSETLHLAGLLCRIPRRRQRIVYI